MRWNNGRLTQKERYNLISKYLISFIWGRGSRHKLWRFCIEIVSLLLLKLTVRRDKECREREAYMAGREGEDRRRRHQQPPLTDPRSHTKPCYCFVNVYACTKIMPAYETWVTLLALGLYLKTSKIHFNNCLITNENKTLFLMMLDFVLFINSLLNQLNI